MTDYAALATFDPPDPEDDRAPYIDAGLMPRAEAERLAALWHIQRARAQLAALADALRTAPGEEGDAEADESIRQTLVECDRAGAHIATLRNIRECHGWA